MSVDTSSRRSSTHRSGNSPSHGTPDESAFAIGDNSDDEEEDGQSTPGANTAHTPQHSTPSRASSVTSEVDDAVPIQLRGMSEKARGKMPAGAQPGISRQNSMASQSGSGPSLNGNGMFEPSAAWLDSWLPNLPLHTILSVIDQVTPLIPRDKDVMHILRTIESTEVQGLEVQSLRIHNFEWSPLSLGWYESLLWSFVYVNEMQFSKGTVGVWNGTSIKLFRVQEAAPEGVSLMRPRGAVDAVGANIATRIGSLQLANRASELVGATRQAATTNANGRLQEGDRPSGGNGRSAVV